MQKRFTPEFSALMAQYRDTAAGLGDQHREVVDLALKLRNALDGIAAELGESLDAG